MLVAEPLSPATLLASLLGSTGISKRFSKDGEDNSKFCLRHLGKDQYLMLIDAYMVQFIDK